VLNNPISKLIKPIFRLICIYCLVSLAHADDELPGSCKRAPEPDANQVLTPIDPNTPAEFTADRAKRDENGVATLEGSVHMIRNSQTVDADTVKYDEKQKKVYAQGNVVAEDQQLLIQSDAAELHLNTDYAKSSTADYKYKPQHARGSAETIERTSTDFIRFENTTYTTCEEGNEAWKLSADKVELNKASGAGIGRNVLVKFKGVPVFYTPWIRFPIDDRRKTGFLTPVIGTSNDSGFDLETPFYWNIAPNRDAIISPRILSDRGLQLKTDFRYLNEKSFGHIGGEYLDDSEENDDRFLLALEHTSHFTERLQLNLLYNQVSDENYFEDLGDSLGTSSTQNIEQHANLSYFTKHWNFLARAQDFQVVDDSLISIDEPFERLPQIRIDGNYARLPGGFDLRSENEWVSFEHDEQTDGDRLHVGLELERPFEGIAYFVRPGVRFTHTEYDLNQTALDESLGFDDTPSRSLPSAHIDAGLVFERNLKAANHVQTLEPRVYYLHTPFRDQDDFPLFDTTELEFGFDQLFRDDRFSGFDRIGDADRLSLGITTRVVDLDSGKEKLRASLGRIIHFRDRNVTLPGGIIDDEDSSEVAAELQISLSDRWDAVASALYDTHDDHTERNSVRFQYRGKNDFIFNAAYRYRRRDIEIIDPISGELESLEQSDFSMVLPINEQWRAVSRWNYDLQEQRNLEQLVGVEYDTCCWKLRVAGRRFRQDTDANFNNTIELQLVLKGLGQIGSSVGEFLERGIRGYEDRDDEFFTLN